MVAAAEKTFVPAYSLKESGRRGNALIEVLRACGLTPQQKDLFFVPHRKDFYMLVLVRQGNSRHWVDMAPYTIQPDRLYFTTPQQVHLKEEAGGLFQATSICFTEEFLGMEENYLLKQLPIIQNLHNGHELVLSAEDLVFLDDITGKLLAEQDSNEDWHSSMLLAYLRILLIYASRLYTAQFAQAAIPDKGTLLHQFKTLITAHFTEYHDVAAYAGMLHLSPGHFSEQIKEQSGKTAMEHIHDRLLLEAKRMLFHTDQSMKEIAYQLGFKEESYFNRFFKRLTDITPLRYRTTIPRKVPLIPV